MLKISVIIPVYNMEKYLGECLDSIRKQTLKEIEIICINDGSTDHSLEILNLYKDKYNNMTVLTQENTGQGEARNAGIKLAKGEFLMFVDPDDCLPSDDVLEELYNKAKMNNVEVCGGNLATKSEGKGLEFFDIIYNKYKIDREGIYQFKEYQYVGSHQRYVYKREFLIQNGLFYPNYRRGEDMPFLARVLNCTKRFYLLDKVVYLYRRSHKEERFTLQKADDLIMSYCDVIELAIDNNLEELYRGFAERINSIAKRYWYKLLYVNQRWSEICKVNELLFKGNATFGNEKKSNYLMDKEEYDAFLKDMTDDWKKTEKIIKKNEKIAIYGTGEVGRRIKRYLETKGYRVNYFVVSGNIGINLDIDGVDVISLDSLNNDKEYIFILGSLSQAVRNNMKEQLLYKGINNILDFNSDIVGCFGD